MMYEHEDEKYVNFSNYPQSVTELRAGRDGIAYHASPRDALISILRDIDRGILVPSSLIIVFDKPPIDGGNRPGTFYIAAVKGFHRAIGLMERAKYLMQKG